MGYSKSAAGVTGANALISIDTSTASPNSATAGVKGARLLVRSMFASGAISEKSASTGVEGAKDKKSTTAMVASSKVASTGVVGASVINALSFATGAVIVSLPAKRMPALSVRTAAKIAIVAFILLLFLFDEAKIYRMCDVSQLESFGLGL